MASIGYKNCKKYTYINMRKHERFKVQIKTTVIGGWKNSRHYDGSSLLINSASGNDPRLTEAIANPSYHKQLFCQC